MKQIQFHLNGADHVIAFKGAKISVDNGEFQKLKSFHSEKEASETRFTIPVGGDNVYLYRFMEDNVVQNGINLVTGEPHTPVKVPKWTWVFYALDILAFLFIIGGLVGGILFGGSAAMTTSISVSRKYKGTPKRVILCALTFLAAVVIGLIFSFIFFKAQ